MVQGEIQNLTINLFACPENPSAKMLANTLKYKCFDVDTMVELTHEKKPVSEIFKEFGQDYFRDCESQASAQEFRGCPLIGYQGHKEPGESLDNPKGVYLLGTTAFKAYRWWISFCGPINYPCLRTGPQDALPLQVLRHCHGRWGGTKAHELELHAARHRRLAGRHPRAPGQAGGQGRVGKAAATG